MMKKQHHNFQIKSLLKDQRGLGLIEVGVVLAVLMLALSSFFTLLDNTMAFMNAEQKKLNAYQATVSQLEVARAAFLMGDINIGTGETAKTVMKFSEYQGVQYAHEIVYTKVPSSVLPDDLVEISVTTNWDHASGIPISFKTYSTKRK